MNETPPALGALDPKMLQPLVPLLVTLPIDAEAAGTPELPADHPRWQCDVISLSSRARSVAAAVTPAVVRALSYWDHRLREVAFESRTLALDPAGCYRLR